ncbi:MAG: hypothetical protein Q9185_002490 [Variospora sp. 1 TL-2023]
MSSPSPVPDKRKTRKRIFTGTFISAPTRTSLSVLTNAAVGVDEDGTIAWIEQPAAHYCAGAAAGQSGRVSGSSSSSNTVEEDTAGGGGEGDDGWVRDDGGAVVRKGEVWGKEEREGCEVVGLDDAGEGEGEGKERTGWWFPGFVEQEEEMDWIVRERGFGIEGFDDFPFSKGLKAESQRYSQIYILLLHTIFSLSVNSPLSYIFFLPRASQISKPTLHNKTPLTAPPPSSPSDTHTHAAQLPNAGLFGTSTLLSWLTTYTFPLESSLSSLPTARRIYTAAVTSTLRHGTTTAAYYATIHPQSTNLLADICLQKGQRAFIGRVCMDRPATCPDYYRDESAEKAMQDTKEVVQYIRSQDPRGELVRPILTPRFAPACTKAMLAALGQYARSEREHHHHQHLPMIQTHISETKAEVTLVQQLFPDRKNYADVYDHYGLLGPSTVLAHAIHLSAAEIHLVKDRRAGVSHCPRSNTSLGSGICPVRALLDAGVKVGLGTDVSGGGSCSLLAAARDAAGVSRLLSCASSSSSFRRNGNDDDDERVKLSVAECLHLATSGGAEVLGLGGKVGGFEVGMQWDAQLVRLDRVPTTTGEGDGGGIGIGIVGEGLAQCWGGETWEEKVAKWMYCGDDRNTRQVWVGGRLVWER